MFNGNFLKNCVKVLYLMKIIEMKHKVILLLLLTLMHFSCQNKNEIYDDELISIFDEKAKNLFLKSENNIPIKNQLINVQLFIKVKSNEFALTDISELAYFYDIWYEEEYETFKEFLYDILNQKIFLARELVAKLEYSPVVINPQIVDKYLNLGMDKVLEKYFVKIDKRWILDYNIKLSNDENRALKYYMFSKRKFFTTDCYAGITYCNDFEVYRKKD